MVSPRSEKIKSIIEARRPMVAKLQAADESLNQIETQIRNFKHVIPTFASRLDQHSAGSVTALEPEIDSLLAKISVEKAKLALLAGRFSRSTLNIGVLGQARQGKSQLLQTITGLSPNEIPSGDKGHCTGAPSIIANRQGETYADLTFHTESSFIHNVVQPFFSRLGLSPAPSSLDDFASARIPVEGSEEAKNFGATENAHLRKLLTFQKSIGSYRGLLGSSRRRVEKQEIREYIAQEDAAENPLYKWIAVQLAEIYCDFPQSDVGSLALADTPGLGDFQSGAEERLAATIGSRLDCALMLKLPEGVGPLVKPTDTGLADLIQKAVPDLETSDWTDFLINTYPAKSPDVDFFEKELRKSTIGMRNIHKVDVISPAEVSAFLDKLLNDIAGNLQALDGKLFLHRMASLEVLADSIRLFAKSASQALPKAASVQPDQVLFNKLFGDVWMNLGAKLKELVLAYRNKRDEPDQEFLSALKAVFSTLDQGPKLPEAAAIDKEAATAGLMTWHAEKLHELRVRIANSFESIDPSLHSSFDRLRAEILSVLTAESGGKLAGLDSPKKGMAWKLLLERWEGHDGGEVIRHAIDLLMSAGLSFRGFIQPRVRHCLDVLDSESPDAEPFCFIPGDTSKDTKDKLELAWERACFKCRGKIEDMAKEPAMARFAAAEDFRESILRTGGAYRSRESWHMFYHENRAEIWPEEFTELEANTHLRKEWENAIRALSEAAEAIGNQH